jgi:ABC-type multidrug transport system ATPase subunit
MKNYAIDVQGMAKSFGTLKVVEDLSLRVGTGEICGFLGGNGSGKTTTIRLLCGLLTPDKGSGTCLGTDIMRAGKLRSQIGYMTQHFSYYPDLTIAENLNFVAHVYGLPNRRQKVEDMMDRMVLSARRDQLAGALSGGWKQRLALAAAVLHGPRLLLLDEPTAGVDAKARREFWDLIVDMAAGGMTVLISTHYMDEAERCQRLAYLHQGRIIIAGTAAEVITASDLIAFDIEGDDIEHALKILAADKRTGNVARFGNAVHAANHKKSKLPEALATLNELRVTIKPVAPRLDDAFIHFLGTGGPK